jgi:hypothetical protein
MQAGPSAFAAVRAGTEAGLKPRPTAEHQRQNQREGRSHFLISETAVDLGDRRSRSVVWIATGE